MNAKAKFVMIGLDGLISGYVKKFVREGKMPNVARLMKKGAYADILPAFPCDTPTNWTSFATGAWPSVHGIVGFYAHLPGEPLTTIHETLNTGMCKAEFIWDVAEKAGMKPFILTYPGAFPSTMKKGALIQGMHGDCVFTRENISPPPSKRLSIDSPALYCHGEDINDERFVARPLKFKEADQNESPQKYPPLEAIIPISSNSGLEWGAMGWTSRTEMKTKKKAKMLRLVATASSQRTGYDAVEIYKDGKKLLTRLKPGEWSGHFTEDFEMEDGSKVKGSFCFKLLELDKNGKKIRLYRSKIYRSRGWCSKKKMETEIEKNVGPFIYGFEQGAGYCDIDLCLEHARLQADYYVRLSKYMKDVHGSDFIMLKFHLQDAMNHWLLNEFEPLWEMFDQKKAKTAKRQYEESYRVVDELVGRVMDEVADENALVAVLSDHGAVPIFRKIDYRPVFIKAGLMKYKKKDGKYILDLSATKAAMIGDKIFINLKGREKNGIVKKSDYEKICDEIISALSSTIDPATGLSPFTIVCRRKDLEIHGVRNERYGDVVPIAKTGYWLVGGEILPHIPSDIDPAVIPPVSANNERPICGAHFGVMPNAQHGLASNHALMILAGKGIRQGCEVPHCVKPVDVAPTICRALGLKAPAQNEGSELTGIFK